MNPYTVLGVSETASASDIKRAYRNLAKSHHPDAGGDPEQFEEIKSAYDVLMDGDRRHHFDETGEVIYRTADNRDGAALQIIHMALFSALSVGAEEMLFRDIVDLMRKSVEETRLGAFKEQGGINETCANLRKLQGRFRRSSAGSNILESMVASEIAGLEQRATAISETLNACKRALEILKDYTFQADQRLRLPSHYDPMRQGANSAYGQNQPYNGHALGSIFDGYPYR